MIFDSGCTTTQYPLLKFWDFDNFKFKEVSDENEIDKKMNDWNEHILLYSINTVKTANNNKNILKLFLK